MIDDAPVDTYVFNHPYILAPIATERGTMLLSILTISRELSEAKLAPA